MQTIIIDVISYRIQCDHICPIPTVVKIYAHMAEPAFAITFTAASLSTSRYSFRLNIAYAMPHPAA
ncbi:hypothetical protein, partial [uncultured Pluralibacter sp.]|uniref:hypothetical protein n=1 Tax=uncultured Pluralibacter sp. TaxID=1490864 RepID=UPI00261A97A0